MLECGSCRKWVYGLGVFAASFSAKDRPTHFRPRPAKSQSATVRVAVHLRLCGNVPLRVGDSELWSERGP